MMRWQDDIIIIISIISIASKPRPGLPDGVVRTNPRAELERALGLLVVIYFFFLNNTENELRRVGELRAIG
jgi:hypothetical protein